jgi:hypothetical protein
MNILLKVCDRCLDENFTLRVCLQLHRTRILVVARKPTATPPRPLTSKPQITSEEFLNVSNIKNFLSSDIRRQDGLPALQSHNNRVILRIGFAGLNNTWGSPISFVSQRTGRCSEIKF